MIAAVGNRVAEVGGLHRSCIGSLALPADLKPGAWRWLTAQDLAGSADTTSQAFVQKNKEKNKGHPPR